MSPNSSINISKNSEAAISRASNAILTSMVVRQSTGHSLNTDLVSDDVWRVVHENAGIRLRSGHFRVRALQRRQECAVDERRLGTVETRCHVTRHSKERVLKTRINRSTKMSFSGIDRLEIKETTSMQLSNQPCQIKDFQNLPDRSRTE